MHQPTVGEVTGELVTGMCRTTRAIPRDEPTERTSTGRHRAALSGTGPGEQTLPISALPT